MLCDNCKKNEATVHIKEFHNGKCETHHLCSDCANVKEENGELGSIGLKLSELLFNAGKLSEAANPGKAQNPAGPYDTLVCPVCSWTAAKIRKHNAQNDRTACNQAHVFLFHICPHPYFLDAASDMIFSCVASCISISPVFSPSHMTTILSDILKSSCISEEIIMSDFPSSASWFMSL